MKKVNHTLPLLLILAFCFQVNAQSASKLIKEGDRYYEHGKFRSALQYYRQAGSAATWKPNVKLRAAICQYEINEIDGAIPLLAELVQAGKTDPEVFLYLGRCSHHKNQFSRAIGFYKEFLRRYTDNTPLREWVKDEVLRCANGISQRFAGERAYVENMGAAINSVGDDYSPIPSPNYGERLYFTSAREDSEGGMLADNGTPDLKYGSYRSDIYYTEHENGIWRSASPLDHVLNSRQNEEILCFSSDGQQMFFQRGRSDGTSDLIIDTFSIPSKVNPEGTTLGDFKLLQGDKDLFLYNDTMMLFSSSRPGGYGGYDIYYSIRHKGRWKEAKNIGRAINSFYDEVSPFLVRDGRTIFVSSNRLESIGGLDVFTARFDDSTSRWTPLTNMGLPVNSAADDADFYLAADGYMALMSSDRKSGFGKRDVYSVYFKEQVREHLILSVPLTFAQFESEEVDAIMPSVPAGRQEVREYVISDLWFEPNDLVITPQNIKKLEVLTNLLLIYPTLKLDLICHDVSSGPRSYDLFFSVKKSEQVAHYLVRKGVVQDRVYIKGCGAYYPLANDGNQALHNRPAIDRLNRRIELHVYHAEDQPLSIIMDEPSIPENMKDPRGARFDALQSQLVYRVQIASAAQLLQHDVFDAYSDAMVDYNPSNRRYRYLIGMETQYHNAAILRDALRGQGFADAFVVAYLDGKQLTKAEAMAHSEEYPDLLNFVQ